MFRILWRKKVMVIFLAALIVLFPAASIKPAQMLSKTLFLSIGIDKDASGYEISGIVSVNTPSQTGATTTKPVSGRASSINAALKKIEANQGRTVSLAHCNLIVVGAGAANENLAAILHHFLRQYEMSNNTLIIYTESGVKELLDTSIANKTGSSAGMLETIAAQAHTTTLDKFYKNYIRPSSSEIVNIVNLEKEEIDNTKNGAVFKNGKKLFNLSADQMQVVRMLNNHRTHDTVILDANGNQVVLSIKSAASQIKTKIEDGTPVVRITINVTAEVNEIIDSGNPETYLDFENLPQSMIKNAYTQKLTADTELTLDALKLHKADFLRLYDRFHKYNTSPFARYMKANDIDTLLEQIEYFVDTNVKIVV